MDNLDRVNNCIRTMQEQKDKLKNLVRYSRKELRKTKRKLKDASLESLNKRDQLEEMRKTFEHMKEKVKLQEDKLRYYKKQEMEVSLAKSFRTNASDDLNIKLIEQNKELLERFYQEEKRVNELEDENERLLNLKKRSDHRVSKLRAELKEAGKRLRDKVDEPSNVKDLKAEIVLLTRIRDRLQEDNQNYGERNKVLTIERNTYEKKLNEVIDEHNLAVAEYEKELEAATAKNRKLSNGKSTRGRTTSKSKKDLKGMFESSLSESGGKFNEKESIIEINRLENENRKLQIDNQEYRLAVLNVKQENMNMRNKNILLRKRIKRIEKMERRRRQ